jgi:cytochrome P450
MSFLFIKRGFFLVEVDGYILPKGSILITNMESIHKNPERFPQGEQFIPERFMTNLKTMQSAANGKLENRDHFIFGWGRYV